MSKITDLDVLLPPDLEFKRGDTTYLVPGDLPIETVLELFKLYSEISQGSVEQQTARERAIGQAVADSLAALGTSANAKAKTQRVRQILDRLLDERATAAAAIAEGDDEARAASEKSGAVLLRVLQIRQPDLTEVPFGAAGRRIVLQQILINLGVMADPSALAEGDEPDPQSRRARSQRSSS